MRHIVSLLQVSGRCQLVRGRQHEPVGLGGGGWVRQGVGHAVGGGEASGVALLDDSGVARAVEAAEQSLSGQHARRRCEVMGHQGWMAIESCMRQSNIRRSATFPISAEEWILCCANARITEPRNHSLADQST